METNLTTNGGDADAKVHTFDSRSTAIDSDGQLALLFTWQTEEENPGRAWPTRPITISGHSVHLFALRVMDVRGYQFAWDDDHDAEAQAVCQSELVAAQTMAEGRLEAHELPGLAGEWIIVAHSFAD